MLKSQVIILVIVIVEDRLVLSTFLLSGVSSLTQASGFLDIQSSYHSRQSTTVKKRSEDTLNINNIN